MRREACRLDAGAAAIRELLGFAPLPFYSCKVREAPIGVGLARAGDAVEGAYAPIVRAVGDRRAYILDAALQPVPVGVTGELHLGGDALARGYLGQAGQTADRFIPDPFPELSGREMLRHGPDVAFETCRRIRLGVMPARGARPTL